MSSPFDDSEFEEDEVELDELELEVEEYPEAFGDTYADEDDSFEDLDYDP